MKKAPTTLIIVDGLGLSARPEGNAVKAAKTPVLDRLCGAYAHTTLAASGADVGMGEGQSGNGAAGRNNIGGGRIVPQALKRIDDAIADGTFFENPAYNKAMDACLEKGTALHLMGLVSDGMSHASIAHLFALLKMASIKGLTRVYIHGFLDGRDVAPRSGRAFVERVQKACAEYGVGRLATVMGRAYAMDRAKRWERTEIAYDALVYGEGVQNADPLAAVQDSYRDGVPDQLLEPVVCDRDGMIADNDSVIFCNFRGDCARELTRAFVDPDFSGFKRERFPVTFVCTAEYDSRMPNVSVAFPFPPVKNDLRAYLTEMDMTQLRVADADACVEGIMTGEYDVVILRLPDCDDAGDTGDFDAAVRAVEAADAKVGKVVDATMQMGGIAMVTASHGNVERMRDAEGRPSGANTTNRVPFILCGAGTELREGRLADIAPTILDVLGLIQPPEMTGKTLILR